MAALAMSTGCQNNSFSSRDGSTPGDSQGTCGEGEGRCEGDTYQVCHDLQFADVETCVAPRVCSASLGCADCDPGLNICVGDEVHKCGPGGTIGAMVRTCPPGTCAGGACNDPCSQAEARRSYVGCSYWPTVTINSMLGVEFEFAVAVANASKVAAEIRIASATNPTVATATVGPNSVATLKLPWVMDLRQDSTDASDPMKTKPEVSVLKSGGAYHLTSSVPVTVYQFNPLDYVINKDCKYEYQIQPVPPIDGKCYSYSNDASLLLPEHALSTEYMVIARPTMGFKPLSSPLAPSVPTRFSPGFFSVVATKPGTTKVSVTFSADTQAGSGGLAAYSRGQKASFDLAQWSVLQILSKIPTSCTPATTDTGFSYCDLSQDSDLTGTEVSADKDVALFAGHNCTFAPYNKWACDHLEEQLFPVKSWGKEYIATHTSSSGKDPCIYRLVSADNGNQITFEPAVSAPVTLDRGKFIEVTTDKDFKVKGSGRFALSQFMVGQNYSTTNAGQGAPNDPAMALAVPLEQYRTSYWFLAPGSYSQSYVNVVAPASAEVKLDGAVVPASQFAAIGSSGYTAAKVKVSGGSHLIESVDPFGIMVYGVGSYTSYMYPGGLDLRILVD